MTGNIDRLRHFLTSVCAIVAILVLVPPLSARQPAAKTKIFALKLVEQTMAKHRESDEIGISVRSSRGCKTIASTDPTDIGEPCERDDVEPMRTGKPYVERERDGYDVTVPLRDEQGQIVGSVGVGFKRTAGQTQAEVVAAAVKISKEMAAQISSKPELFRFQR